MYIKGGKFIMRGYIKENLTIKVAKALKENEGASDFDFILDKLNALKSHKYDNVTTGLGRNPNEKVISVHFYRGDNNLYGDINVTNRTTKLTASSGPNPLEEGFPELLITLKNILPGYSHLHY